MSRSQEAIRKMLMENGAMIHQFTEMPTECVIEVKWARRVRVNNVDVIQPLRVRVSTKGRKVQQVWRVLVHHLKAKFEVVRFGVLTFEEEFLPYFLTHLPDGREVTVAEMLVPGLRRALPAFLNPLPMLSPGAFCTTHQRLLAECESVRARGGTTAGPCEVPVGGSR